MLTFFSQIMVDVKFPFVVYRKGHGFQIRSFGLFKLFPVSTKSSAVYYLNDLRVIDITDLFLKVLLTISIMWTVCAILTVSNVLEEGHPARTDARLRVLTDSAWLYIPYPGQFGLPTVTMAGNFSHNCISSLNTMYINSIRCAWNAGRSLGVHRGIN